MIYTILLFLSGFNVALSSTSLLHIVPKENTLIVYAGSHYPMSIGGILIAGGEEGNEQYGLVPDIPYAGYPSQVDAGEIPCGITSIDKNYNADKADDSNDANDANDADETKQCKAAGTRFNFDTKVSIPHDKFIRMVLHPDYRKFGEYDVNMTDIMWARVVIPINKCGEGVHYSLSTTADECYDRPVMNTWIDVECIPYDPSKVAPVKEKKKAQIDIIELQSLAKRMEENGMYGVEDYIDQIIMEVLITKTNAINKKVIKLIKPSKGIILYGPPGTGKTTLAKNLAIILGDGDEKKVKMITSTEVLSKWHGQSEENVRELFDDAIKAQARLGEDSPLYFLIIDEIDAVLSHRGESTGNSVHDPIVNQFLGLMDGLVESSNLIVIGITNRLDRMDSACLRPGRFGCKIEIDLPNLEQRTIIWEKYYQRVLDANIIDDRIDCKKLSKLSDKFSGADIEYIFDTSIKHYIINVLDNKDKKITERDLVKLVMKYKK